MPSKYHFWRITNNHIQKLYGLDVKQASYKLNKFKEACGKKSIDDLHFFELCKLGKLNCDEVPLILGWDDKKK